MAFGEGSFRSRAASLLHPGTPSTNRSVGWDVQKEKGTKSSTEPTLNEKPSLENESHNHSEKRQDTNGKVNGASGRNAATQNRDAQRNVRSVPAWVRTIDEDDEYLHEVAQNFPLIPPDSLAAHHNYSPSTVPRLIRTGIPRGRLHDQQRDSIPPLPSGTFTENNSRWKAFAEASAYPAISAEGGEIVGEEWLERNGPDYSRPWLGGDDDGGDHEKGMRMFRAKRRAWYVRVQRTLLRNPLVPMIIRLNVWSYSAVALGLACAIHHLTDDRHNSAQQTPSTNMAIIVDAVAMVYLLYIAYDEYSSKPLGLRSARAKMRLIFLDLFFIVFDSANLSLAFEAIQGGTCVSSSHGHVQQICDMQKGLASVLLVALIAWLLTFAISVLRLIEKISGR